MKMMYTPLSPSFVIDSSREPKPVWFDEMNATLSDKLCVMQMIAIYMNPPVDRQPFTEKIHWFVFIDEDGIICPVSSESTAEWMPVDNDGDEQ